MRFLVLILSVVGLSLATRMLVPASFYTLTALYVLIGLILAFLWYRRI